MSQKVSSTVLSLFERFGYMMSKIDLLGRCMKKLVLQTRSLKLAQMAIQRAIRDADDNFTEVDEIQNSEIDRLKKCVESLGQRVYALEQTKVVTSVTVTPQPPVPEQFKWPDSPNLPVKIDTQFISATPPQLPIQVEDNVSEM